MASLPPTPFPLPTIPPPPIVLGDLPCRKCSYNLRTLPTTAVCPECATPIADSMRSDLLHDGDPHWLQTVRRGVKLLWITCCLYALWVAAVSLFLQASSLQEAQWIQILVGRLMQGAGIWLATTPDPRRRNQPGSANFSLACRAMAVINFAAGILWLGTMFRFAPSSPLWAAARLLNMGTGIVNQALILFYLSRLMLRIPDVNISRIVWWSAIVVTMESTLGFVSRFNSRFIHLFFWKLPGSRQLIEIAALIALAMVLNALRLCNAAIHRETR